jgi:isochorismate pyruvate lyase
MELKKPSDCQNKDEIRSQIDLVDNEIIQLFATRFQYVEEIVKYKIDEESVIAIDRKMEVIKNRGELAEKLGLDRATYENIYKILIENNISKELKILENSK